MTVARSFGPIYLANENFHFEEGRRVDKGQEEGDAIISVGLPDCTDLKIMVKWRNGMVHFTGYEYTSPTYKERISYEEYGFEVDL